MKNKIGIVGFGSFGQFIFKQLHEYFDICIHDPHLSKYTLEDFDIVNTPYQGFKNIPIVILAVPVQHLSKVIDYLSPHLKEDALVIDVSSVKVKPVDLMLAKLPKTVQILGTHPLFGPQSGANGIKGFNIVLCQVRISDKNFKRIIHFLEDEVGLNLLIRTPELHDKQMAYVQALTHFIGRAINEIDIPDIEQKTPAYQYLLDIKRNLGKDSMDLFLTIERENPYSADVVDEFMTELKRLKKLI